MERPTRMAQQPLTDLGMLVGGVVVGDCMDELPGRHGCLHRIEESDEFLVPMLQHTTADDLAVQHVEGCEQRGGAVPGDTSALIDLILRSRPHPEQGFRSCIGILRLQKSYDAERLDAACARALALGTRSYSSVATILKNRQDHRARAEAEQPSMFHENIRGPGYYH